jgi:WD40 repeat protein
MKPLSIVNQDSQVTKVRFHPLENRLVSLSATADDVCLWKWDEPEDLGLLKRFGAMKVDARRVMDAAFSPDGKLLAAVGMNRPVQLWRVPEGKLEQSLGSAEGPEDYRGYSAVIFSASGKLVVATSLGQLRTEVYEVKSGKLVETYWGDAFNTGFALHPEGQILANIMNDQGENNIRFGILTDSFQGYNLQLEGYTDFGGMAFSPDGKALALVGGVPPVDLQVHTFPSLKMRFEETFEPPHELAKPWIFEGGSPFVERVVFSPDSKRLICPAPTGHLLELDALKGKQLRKWKAHEGVATTVDIRYADMLLASGGMDGAIKLWQLDYKAVALPPKDQTVTKTFLNKWKPVGPFAKWNEFESIDE